MERRIGITSAALGVVLLITLGLQPETSGLWRPAWVACMALESPAYAHNGDNLTCGNMDNPYPQDLDPDAANHIEQMLEVASVWEGRRVKFAVMVTSTVLFVLIIALGFTVPQFVRWSDLRGIAAESGVKVPFYTFFYFSKESAKWLLFDMARAVLAAKKGAENDRRKDAFRLASASLTRLGMMVDVPSLGDCLKAVASSPSDKQ